MAGAVVGLSHHRTALDRLAVLRASATAGMEPVGRTLEEAD